MRGGNSDLTRCGFLPRGAPRFGSARALWSSGARPSRIWLASPPSPSGRVVVAEVRSDRYASMPTRRLRNIFPPAGKHKPEE